MKNKNGFTLIELLCVIIILAVISLITVPLVLSTVTDSRKTTLRNSYQSLLKAVDMNKSYDDIDFTQEYSIKNGKISPDIDFDGELDGNGKIMVNKDGKIKLIVETEDWCIYKSYDSNKVEAQDGDCSKVDIDPSSES